MAEAFLFDLAIKIMTMLGSHTIQEIGLYYGFKDELHKLNRMVSTIKVVLLHAEELSSENLQVKEWLSMLKDAFYDADDLLDELSLKALQKQVMTGTRMAKEVRLFFSSSNPFAYGLKMAHKIKAIRETLAEIAENKKFFLEERHEERRIAANKARDQVHSSPPEVVVGREHDKEAIIELLMKSSDEENVSIIPIIGIGGLGKTTLAQLVYNDEKVKGQFEPKAWACVSDNFDVKLIVEKILESVSRQKPNCSEMDALKSLLHEKIIGKKYLIVLDDIWNEDSEKWNRLKDLLVGGARGNKIIITTRLRKVAELARPIAMYELQGLPKSESWSLFEKIAFKRGQVVSQSHEDIGREIVAKCWGVPLAIRTIGSLLYFKDSESEWLSFKSKELSKVDQCESDILPTLKLSYNYLPSHLKQCFAYCALFPKDYKIDIDMLIHLWMAQGYVKPSDPSQCLINVGLEYFGDLLWRSFFQEVEKDDFGNYTTCKIHDLMHDLAMSVAGEECASSNFEVGYTNEKICHISFVCDWRSHLKPSMFNKTNKVRTFLLLNSGSFLGNEELCHSIFHNMRRLRVLDLYGLDLNTLPFSVEKLKHLRYLDLSRNRSIKKLPDSITKLQNLQVLKLAGCRELIHLPKDTRRLVNLRCLDLGFCLGLTHMPRGIGQLSSLEGLSRFVVAKDNTVCSGLGELQGLNNLRGELKIVNLGYVKNGKSEFKAANLKEKQHLQSLALEWNKDGDDSEGANDVENDEMELEALRPHQNLKELSLEFYRGVKFPSWISSLTNLMSIRFCSCKSIKRLPPFDQLLSLQSLYISGLTNLEYIVTDGGSSSFFPSLTRLYLYHCPNLKGWLTCVRNDGTADLLRFPCLSILYFHNCPNLTSMPLVPSLEKLEFVGGGGKQLEHIIKMIISASQSSSFSSSSSSSSFPISQFKDLSIYEVEDLEFLPELLFNLTSLQSLSILSCQKITTLSRDENDKGMQWQGLQNLRSLEFYDNGSLVSLPKGLQYATTLHRLDIEDCPNLMSLAEGMDNLTELQILRILRCPQLEAKCEKNVGEDWPKVAHIPNIYINGEEIQRNL
ncbi:putative disease resistance protein RGA1 [Hevea brasiliensis]|uniref:putative disease resistance protein RGA1 n=1 Tax=Hevea brasiliensis TaxID=3981 RepID=UPI0025DEF449|nr:putative disease resistance protein RGA1 [Hevea brasiliensis]